ncbi:MarR family winged helix-turn-helix transcriptional regulator [Streptomyces winkii]|uniref:MarR family winged helix-turn-helix transcriptional regulator n=1 Tax=Streptomyces winkii TaxID=3051178 RepID=UPI0028D21CBC|nr:MarR family transcriptional regulator [Streptomyces sp. DSM 40971]
MPARGARSRYEELARHLSGLGAVRRELVRALPVDCPPGSAGVLTLLHKYGEMRMGRLAELMAVDMSVTSRHVTHNVERGWVVREPDPEDGRSRLLRLTEQGERQLNRLSEITTGTLESVLHDWTEDDVARLNGMLERLRQDFGDCRVPAQAERPEPGPAARTTGDGEKGTAGGTGTTSTDSATSTTG